MYPPGKPPWGHGPPPQNAYGGPVPNAYDPTATPYGTATPVHHGIVSSSTAERITEEEDDMEAEYDGAIPTSPSWAAIGVLVAVVLFGVGMGAAGGFLVAEQGAVWLGALLGGFTAATFGVATIGWTYKNMDWIPMSYGERTVVLVMGVSFLASPLVLYVLHGGV